jgi:FKBP-type peptidyl-prolyl cis-trans isomerase
LDKREAKLSQKELDAIQFYIKNGIKYEKKLNEQIQIGVEYMKKNKAKAGVIETPTGLQYT